MKNNIKKLLAAALIFGNISFIKAGNPKTFFMPRPHIADLPLEYSLFHNHAYRPGRNSYNTHVQVSPFLRNSTNGDDLGKHFVFGDRNYFEITADQNGIINQDIGWSRDVVGKVSLSPKQESYGLRIDLFQNLKFPCKNLYLKASTPIFYVRNDLNISVYDQNPNHLTEIQQFFNGEFTGADTKPKLDYAKMPDKAIYKTGVGDIDVILGYKFIDSEKHHLFFNAGLTAPVGTTPTGEYLFEPVYGNGNHFAAGFGLEASLKLWENDKHAARIVTALNYRYLFEGREKRTIGLRIPGHKFAHYFVATRENAFNAFDDSSYISIANHLTQNITVRPGNMFEGLVNFAFTGSKFVVDFGYNLFCKDAEKIIVSPDILKIEKINDTNTYYYVLVVKNDKKYGVVNEAKSKLPKELDPQAASTPSQLTHKIYANLGYTLKAYGSYPISLGIGGAYEFADSKSEMETYAFWIKGVTSF